MLEQGVDMGEFSRSGFHDRVSSDASWGIPEGATQGAKPSSVLRFEGINFALPHELGADKEPRCYDPAIHTVEQQHYSDARIRQCQMRISEEALSRVVVDPVFT